MKKAEVGTLNVERNQLLFSVPTSSLFLIDNLSAQDRIDGFGR